MVTQLKKNSFEKKKNVCFKIIYLMREYVINNNQTRELL
jgi:hypothetical protein